MHLFVCPSVRLYSCSKVYAISSNYYFNKNTRQITSVHFDEISLTDYLKKTHFFKNHMISTANQNNAQCSFDKITRDINNQ